MAQAHQVSYPTVRLRLDRLIQKIQLVEEHQEMSHFERVLRAHYAEGKIDLPTLKELLSAHEKEMENRHEQAQSHR